MFCVFGQTAVPARNYENSSAVYRDVCLCVCIAVYRDVCLCVCIAGYRDVCLSVVQYIVMYVCVLQYIVMYVCMYVCVCVYMCVCMYVCLLCLVLKLFWSYVSELRMSGISF